MRIAMIGAGSRGDVQPTVALGAELAGRGHDIVVSLPDDLVDFGTRLGLATAPLGFRAKDFLESDDGQRWLAAGKVGAYIRGLLEYKLAIADTAWAAAIDATAGADVIVSGFLTENEAACLAEAQRVPLVCLHLAPRRSTGAVASMYVTPRRYPGFVNRATHALTAAVEWRATAGYLNRLRARLGLPPTRRPMLARIARSETLELQGYSRHVVPELAGRRPRRPLVGYLRLTPGQRRALGEGALDPALADWLAAGEPPGFFGFGSMPVRDVPATLALIGTVSRALGVRALVGAGWSRFDTVATDPDTVRVAGGFDHDSVLPRCRFAVHHGGAGTTAASLGAGLPTVVCSVAIDQPFWGRQVTRLGVGRTLPFTALTAARLTAAARPSLAAPVRERVARLAGRLRAEDAVGTAADLVERAVERGIPLH